MVETRISKSSRTNARIEEFVLDNSKNYNT
jgi:hypothetical protein